MKRIAFLGQKAIAERCLAVLRGERFSQRLPVCLLVADESLGLAVRADAKPPVFISNDARRTEQLVTAIVELRIDALISIQHPWILPARVIEAVGGIAFNLHNARLPDYKGHNSISHAILNGESTYATTIHWMVPEVDMGDICAETVLDMMDDETALELYGRTLEAAVSLFENFAAGLADGVAPPRRPVVGEGRFYRRDEIHALKQITSCVDPVEVDRKSRAFYFPPHEPAWIDCAGKRRYVTPRPY